MIEASHLRNVIPGTCLLDVDCRLLPGQTIEEMESILRAGIPGEWEIEWRDQALGGTRSPLASPLWLALESWVARLEPGARLAPICGSGFTDSHYLRQSLGTCAYGFFPLKAMAVELAAELAHSADERIAIDDLELGVDMFRHVATTVAAER